MKKLILLILTLAMVFTLAACGESAATTGKQEPVATTQNHDPVPTTTTVIPTTVPELSETVDLVVSYESGSAILIGESVGPYRMDFTYQADYSGGTVALTMESGVSQGIFACDENYNICYMEFNVNGAVICFSTEFDRAHRLLTARSYVAEGENTKTFCEYEYAYDDRGNVVYSKQDQKNLYLIITETEYTADGKVLSQTTTNDFYTDDAAGTTSETRFQYDENGHILSIDAYDDKGELIQSIPFIHTVQGENDCYTAEADGQKMVLLLNPAGKIILQENYVSGSLANRIETEYDEAGRAVKVYQENVINSTTTEITYAYTADGRRCSNIQIVNGEQFVAERTTYQTVEKPE